VLNLSGIRKRYGAAVALDGADLSVAAGEVHAVLGENGAGKTTLMRVLYGLVRPDAGAMTLGGSAYAPRSPREAMARGVGMVHQHFSLVPALSVRENCVLSAGRGLGAIPRAWDARIAALLARLNWELPLDASIASLAVGQQQRVEIAKALLAAQADGDDLAGRVLILDEPTAVLTPPEVDELLPALRRLADGGAAVILITHKLAEVVRSCDAVTVLRRGRTVHTGRATGLDPAALAALMLGEMPAAAAVSRRTAAAEAPVRLGVAGLTVAGAPGGRAALDNVSLSVRAGEIVGIAGVDGNGQRELVRAVLGLDAPQTGRVTTPGLVGPDRLGLIPDDRHREALVLELPLSDNLALGDHREPPLARWGWWREPAAWRRHALDLVARFGVRAPGVEVPAAALSGGNQQRAVVARALHRAPGLVVAVNPTRGLDVAASRDVLARLVEARDGGAGVLLVHHDLDELLGVADRVLVLCAGRLADSGWPAATREQVGRLMLDAAGGHDA
jgi:simple sugar transport system ATP-binding protein